MLSKTEPSEFSIVITPPPVCEVLPNLHQADNVLLVKLVENNVVAVFVDVPS